LAGPWPDIFFDFTHKNGVAKVLKSSVFIGKKIDFAIVKSLFIIPIRV
jgi:hypothetical protein